jgi:hypothetical protein
MWIDFDVAITYPDSTCIGDRERGWMEIETQCVEGFGVKLVGPRQLSLPTYFHATDKFYRQRIRSRVSS